MSTIKILLADDHPLILDGLDSILSKIPTYKVVGKVNNGLEAVNFLKSRPVDVILMDIDMPVMNGIVATNLIRAKYPSIKILIITMYNETAFVREMMDAGANGYVLKNASKEELVLAIESIWEGKKFISQPILGFNFDKTLRVEPALDSHKDLSEFKLTPREIQLIKMIYHGLGNKEIGEELNIALRTVETHRYHLMRKIGVKNTSGIVQFAIKHHINL